MTEEGFYNQEIFLKDGVSEIRRQNPAFAHLGKKVSQKPLA